MHKAVNLTLKSACGLGELITELTIFLAETHLYTPMALNLWLWFPWYLINMSCSTFCFFSVDVPKAGYNLSRPGSSSVSTSSQRSNSITTFSPSKIVRFLFTSERL